MKFYLVETITFNDETKDNVGIYTKETEAEAIAQAHKELGGWMLKDNVESINVIVKNNVGGIYMNETEPKVAPIVEE